MAMRIPGPRFMGKRKLFHRDFHARADRMEIPMKEKDFPCL
jgi:hypothetical protein